MAITLTQARQAKTSVRRTFSRYGDVVGVGIAKAGDDYCVKVNLSRRPDPAKQLPDSVDGVPVQVEIVGTIRKQAGSPSGSTRRRTKASRSR